MLPFLFLLQLKPNGARKPPPELYPMMKLPTTDPIHPETDLLCPTNVSIMSPVMKKLWSVQSRAGKMLLKPRQERVMSTQSPNADDMKIMVSMVMLAIVVGAVVIVVASVQVLTVERYPNIMTTQSITIRLNAWSGPSRQNLAIRKIILLEYVPLLATIPARVLAVAVLPIISLIQVGVSHTRAMQIPMTPITPLLSRHACPHPVFLAIRTVSLALHL